MQVHQKSKYYLQKRIMVMNEISRKKYIEDQKVLFL